MDNVKEEWIVGKGGKGNSKGKPPGPPPPPKAKPKAKGGGGYSAKSKAQAEAKDAGPKIHTGVVEREVDPSLMEGTIFANITDTGSGIQFDDFLAVPAPAKSS